MEKSGGGGEREEKEPFHWKGEERGLTLEVGFFQAEQKMKFCFYMKEADI